MAVGWHPRHRGGVQLPGARSINGPGHILPRPRDGAGDRPDLGDPIRRPESLRRLVDSGGQSKT